MNKSSIVLLALAAHSPAALSTAPPVTVITRDMLESRLGDSDLLEDLAGRVPTFAGPGTGATSDIRLRGMPNQGAGQPLIIVDGVRLGNTGSADAMNGIDPSNIESIELLKGAAATTLWGAAAQHGVINIRTRKEPKVADPRGSYVLGDVQNALGGYDFSLQSNEACDASEGAAQPSWSYFNKFDYGLPEFTDDGNKAYFGSNDEGFRYDYGFDLPKSDFFIPGQSGKPSIELDSFGYPNLDSLREFDPLGTLTFRHAQELIDKIRQDPQLGKEHADGLMIAMGFAYMFGGSLFPYSDQAVEAGAFDPDDLLREVREWVNSEAGSAPITPLPDAAPVTPPEPATPPQSTPATPPATPASGLAPTPPESPFERYPYPPDYAFDFNTCTPEQREEMESLLQKREQARADMSYYGDYLRRDEQAAADAASDLAKVEEARRTRDEANADLKKAWEACNRPTTTTANSTGSGTHTAPTEPAAPGNEFGAKPGVDWDLEFHVYRNKLDADGSLGTEPAPNIGIDLFRATYRFDLGSRLRYRAPDIDTAPANPLPTNRVFTNSDGVARIPRGFKADFGRPGPAPRAGTGSLDDAASALGDVLLGNPRFSDKTPSGRNWNIGIDYGDVDERPTLGLKFRFDKIDSVVQGYPGLGGPGVTFGGLPDDTKLAIPDSFRERLGRGFSVGNNFYQTFNYAEFRGLDPNLLNNVPGQGGWTNNDCGDTAFPPDGAGYLTAEQTPVKTLADRWALARVNLPDAASPVYEFADPVVVGIIDTGIDWHHPDLPWDALWKNEDEIPDNGIDDDNNGYVDDVIGWDFAGDTGSPYDHDGHGTFVAGLLAAGHGNDIGIDGINPNARIMVLKALNNFGRTRASMVAEAIVYGADNGARILNLSVSGPGFPSVVQDAVDYATSKGVLVVLAAGNGGEELSQVKPAPLRNVLLVGATDADDKRAVFSNLGDSITLAAPGVDVVSLRAANSDFLYASGDTSYVPGDAVIGDDGHYYRGTGTSFAAPIVSGVASLLLSQQPRLTAQEVRRILEQSAHDVDAPGKDLFTGYGVVDASAALRASPDYYVDATILGVQRVDEDGEVFITVGGNATASQFGGARLEIGQGESPRDWISVAEIPMAVERGELARIPAAALEGALTWTVRLVVSHREGGDREAWYRLALE